MKRTAQNVIASVGLLASMACLFSGPVHAAPVVVNYKDANSFPTLLQPGWSTDFVTVTAPVVDDSGKYIAVYGNPNASGTSATQLRVLRIMDKTNTINGEEFDFPFGMTDEQGKVVLPPLFTTPPTWWNQYSSDAHQGNGIEECFHYNATVWYGSPLFGKLTRGVNGQSINSTVLYVLQGDGTNIRPYCIAIDPYNTADNAAATPRSASLATPNVLDAQAGNVIWVGEQIPGNITNAAMTLSADGCLVVTTFGDDTATDGNKVYIYNATDTSGANRLGKLLNYVQNGAGTQQVRLTSPATLVTRDVYLSMSQVESGNAGNPLFATSSGTKTVPATVQFLAVTGETINADGSRLPACYLIPPTLVVPFSTTSGDAALSTIPPDLTLKSAGGLTEAIGDASNAFRNSNILMMKCGDVKKGVVLKITFKTWKIAGQPFTLTYSVYKPNSTTPTTVTKDNLYFSMGYPIVLRGHQRYNVPTTSTMHVEDLEFGYTMSSAPVFMDDCLVIGTNDSGYNAPSVRVSTDQSRTLPDSRTSGMLTAYRLSHPGVATTDPPLTETYRGDIAWQFWGDTFGPSSAAWSGSFPRMWLSDFPYPAATDPATKTVYCVGKYTGTTSMTRAQSVYTSVIPSQYALYAVDTTATRYLHQVVATGNVVSPITGNTKQLRLDQSAVASKGIDMALRVGVRAMITFTATKNTWDLGHVTAIEHPIDYGTHEYRVTFDRPLPTESDDYPFSIPNNVILMVGTSTPYVSHVQGWDPDSGAEPIKAWNTTIRQSEGICNTPPMRNSANPDRRVPQSQGEVMISFSQLGNTCHIPNNVPGGKTMLVPNESATFTFDNTLPYVYLPKTPIVQVGSVYSQRALNYEVDYRTGRIELSPSAAGEFADRFVVVHYFTQDYANGVSSKVRHAEVMYVPSPIIWKCDLPSGYTPDGAPVIAGDRIYVSAQWQTKNSQGTTVWQPTVLTAARMPKDPYAVSWMSLTNVGPAATAQPFRGITTPAALGNGVLIGTAIKTKDMATQADELTLLSTQGTLVADGHRVLRIGSDKEADWEAVGTEDVDGTQHAFNYLTRVRRLPNGNVLVCDTGNSRVAEMDKTGKTVWQYPADGNDYSLSGPRDVRRYYTAEKVSGTTCTRWETTLIADTGNNRIIEVYRQMTKDLSVAGSAYSEVTGSQTSEIIADSNTRIQKEDGTKVAGLGKPLAFTIAMRLNAFPDDKHSKEILAIVGNSVLDPTMPNTTTYLRTVRLLRLDTTTASDNVFVCQTTGTGLNALKTRAKAMKTFGAQSIEANYPQTDYSLVRQLDMVTLTNPTTGGAVYHYLIVDQSGVREIGFDDTTHDVIPFFVMEQDDYRKALINDSYWGQFATAFGLDSTAQSNLTSWRNDNRFAPVAVTRIDPGSYSTTDARKVRYLISQMNTQSNPNPGTNINSTSYPRINLVEMHYGFSTPTETTINPTDWWIVEHKPALNVNLQPAPWWTGFPEIPGTYPLSQPLSIDRD